MATESSDRFWADGRGVDLIPNAVPREAIEPALRLLNLEIRRSGLTAEQIAECQSTTFFPHLRQREEIWGLLAQIEGHPLQVDGECKGNRSSTLHLAGEWAEPQILIRLPDEQPVGPYVPVPHRDTVPPWAEGRRYKAIVGVALSDCGPDDGALCVWPGSHEGRFNPPQTIPTRAGGVVVMHPDLQHAGSLNLGCNVRYAVYFRLLEAGSA